MNYLKSFFLRTWNAFFDIHFWIEFIIVLPFSALGVWIPWSFDWGGKSNFLLPAPWFTFGMTTLVLVFFRRFFMEESEDRYLIANRFLIVFPIVGAAFLYTKSALNYLVVDPSLIPEFEYKYTTYAICLTTIVWLVNFVQINKYDSTDKLNPLGGRL